jgi:2-keto-4-pentenoate hydratase/2-oxohepta-3-ene-1,7-dioic acid hydratase in catechol pathway
MRRATASSRVSKYQFKKPRARLNSALNSRRRPYFELQCCSLAGTRASRNGQTRQSSSTDDFIFNAAQIVSYISRHITLRAGDIIFSGTPEGVILGHPEDKRVWLKAGDKIACRVERLGELRFGLV